MTKLDNKKGKYGAMAEEALKKAVKGALKLHQRMGIPAVFMKNSQLVYLLPDGTITSKAPKTKSLKKTS